MGAQGEVVAGSLGGPGGANDPQDDPFGRLVLDAAHMVLARMQGKPDPAGMTIEFKEPFDEFRKPFLTLGPSTQMLLADGEVALDRTDPAKAGRLTVYSHLQVHGDGQVRWGELSAYVENEFGRERMPFARIPPAMTGLHEHLVHALTQENCLPTPAMRVDDWAYLRKSISQLMDNGDLLTPEDAQKTCAQVGAFTGPWEVHEPELFVAFGTEKQYIIVKLQFIPKPDNTVHIRASLRDTSVSERE